MITLYGIKNCDTIKKARRWLEAQGIDYRFHDYRVDGLDNTLLQSFISELGWEALLNTRGTTWRKLDESTRSQITDAASAAATSACIRRSLLRKAIVNGTANTNARKSDTDCALCTPSSPIIQGNRTIAGT